VDKIDKERQVIFQERWGHYGWLINTLDALGFGYELDRDVRRALYPDSSLGLRIAGEDASLERLDRAALLDYYQQHYTLENAVLIVVGNVEPGQVMQRVEQHFGGLRQSGHPAPPDTPSLPVVGPQQVVVRGPMLTAQVRLMTGARTVGRAHPDRWALDVLAEVLGKSLSEEIRYQRGLVYGLSASSLYFDDAGLFYVNTTSGSGDREAILQTINEHLDRVRQGDISSEDVAEAKAALQGRWALSMEDNVDRAIWLAQWSSLLTDEELVPDYPALVGSVAPGDLSRVVTAYFTPERSYIGLHQPVVTVGSGARIAGAAVALGLSVWGVRHLRQRRRRARTGPDG
jgi:zinc protease